MCFFQKNQRLTVEKSQKDLDLLATKIFKAVERADFADVLKFSKAMQKDFPQCPLGFKAAGFALCQTNEKKRALPYLKKATVLDPTDAEALSNLRQTLTELGDEEEDFDAAFEILKKAQALDPYSPVILNNMAQALLQQHAFRNAQKAKTYAELALKLSPDYAYALANLGIIYFQEKNYDKAQESLERAIAINPNLAFAYNNLGAVFEKRDQRMAALDLQKKAFALEPFNAKYGMGVVSALHGIGESDAAMAYFEKVRKLPSFKPEQFSMHLLIDPYRASVTVEEMGKIARRSHAICLKRTKKHKPFQHTPPKTAKTRLKIGFVSADFRAHAVSFFMLSALKALQGKDFDFIAFDNDKTPDNTTNVLRPFFKEWFEIHALNDDEAAQKIVDCGIDILMDWSGLTAGNRLGVFAKRPAPVQVTYIGWLGGVATPGVDFIITDKIISPDKKSAQEFVETPLVLNQNWACYTPAYDLPEVVDLPYLKNGFVTFGAFQNINKVGAATLKLWANVLHAVPNSKMLFCRGYLREKALVDKYRKDFADLGIDENRLILVGNQNSFEYAEQLKKVDINLDTFPATGGTTTCEALYMGIPVVSLTGELMASRLSASYLFYSGLKDWIAKTPDEYVKKAQYFAQQLVENPNGFNDFRQNLRAQFLKSSVCDTAQFGENFSEGLWRLWKSFETQKPLQNPW